MREKIDVLRVSDRRLHAPQIGGDRHEDKCECQRLPVFKRLHQRDCERHESNERNVIGHYHPEAVEWFTIIEGSAVLKLEDMETHDKREVEMSLEKAITVFIPNNVAHIVVNNSDKDFILLAYTDKLYDPADTIAHKFE